MGPDLAVLHLVLVKKGAEDIPGPRGVQAVSRESAVPFREKRRPH